MWAAAHQTLADALGLCRPELVALVGGGGKSSALRILAEEWAADGRRVLATTTTAMFARQLRAVGPLLVEPDAARLRGGLERLLADASPVAAASAHDAHAKVVGLSPDEVDELWATDLADCIVVEADGCRGRSLKAFAPHEPQIPSRATTVVLMAGVDVVGQPLSDLTVHRAETFARLLGRPLGSRLTTPVVASALRAKVARLRRSTEARIVVFLNKADTGPAEVAGCEVAEALRGAPADGADHAEGRGGGSPAEGEPDLVVVGSLRERRCRAVTAAAVLPVNDPGPTAARSTGAAPRSKVRGEGGEGVAVVAVVLAAGRATRMGRQKLLLPVGGRPMVRRVVDAALRSRAARTVVVVGHEAAAVREAIGDRPVTIVHNPDFAAGMSTSLRAGLAAAGADCDGALFLLGDQPFVTSQLLDLLIERFEQSRPTIVRPAVDDHPANPVLMGAALFPEILQLRGDVGGRDIAARHSADVCLVPVAEAATLMDIDTVKDYRSVRGCA